MEQRTYFRPSREKNVETVDICYELNKRKWKLHIFKRFVSSILSWLEVLKKIRLDTKVFMSNTMYCAELQKHQSSCLRRPSSEFTTELLRCALELLRCTSEVLTLKFSAEELLLYPDHVQYHVLTSCNNFCQSWDHTTTSCNVCTFCLHVAASY